MNATGIQPQLQTSPPPPLISASRAHRWVDLALVLSVAFAGSVLGSAYLAFHPVLPKYSNARVVSGIVSETIGLALFLVLFRRQGRSLRGLGLSFRWTDVPIALGLAVAAFAVMWRAQGALNYVWFMMMLRDPQ